jgi:hypothetical protein
VNGGHRSDRTLDQTRSLFDRTRPVSVQHLRVFQFFDQTRWHVRSIWELTGLQSDAGTVASGQFCSAFGRCLSGALLRLDQSVRYVTRPARPVILRTSDPCDERVRSVLRGVGAVQSVRPVNSTSASGQRDCSCFECLTAIFEGVRL